MFSSLKENSVHYAKLAYETALGQLYINIGNDQRDTIFLAGSGRGGTTWVAELINFDNSYRFIFEPLRARQFKPFHGRRYLRPNEDAPSLAELLRPIVDGRLRNLMSDRHNRQPFPRKRLVKEIIANLSLCWFHRQFPGIPIILLVRHPCAVIASRLRLGNWDYRLRTFLRQESLMSDYLSTFRADMERAATPLDIHLYHWCIETLIPLKQFKPGELHLAFYEELCAEPRRELKRLFGFLGKQVDQRAFDALEHPSSQTLRRELPASPARINGWREQFTRQELDRIRGVVAEFGLDSLYREDGMPDTAAALKLFSG